MDFAQGDLLAQLDTATDAELDALAFGVIRLDAAGHVRAYNRYESEAAGLSRERVLGRHFFTEVGACMNNALVAGRLAGDGAVDVQLDYTFALRLQPQSVRLRLLKPAGTAGAYLLVRR